MAVYALDGVGRCFGRGATAVQALADISLSVEPGEFVAISGPSGSGKSSLLNLLGLLDVEYTGALTVNGLEPRAQTGADLCQQRLGTIGFVFQRFHLLESLDVLANVAWPRWQLGGKRRPAWRRASELLTRFGLGERLRHSVGTLSGGEMQRVALARALVNDPAIVLADEPTGQLDEANARSVALALQEIHRQGKTLVVVTHDPILLAAAERVVSLCFGRVASDRSR